MSPVLEAESMRLCQRGTGDRFGFVAGSDPGEHPTGEHLGQVRAER
ncbi:hypothetical protein [Candidatus Protofrankia californiensis]|nr:hypothetical protein [Candidatus Protofrankia californiensis]